MYVCMRMYEVLEVCEVRDVCTHIDVFMYVCTCVKLQRTRKSKSTEAFVVCRYTGQNISGLRIHMEWLRSVRAIKFKVSFCKRAL